jgi:hypothetical protein
MILYLFLNEGSHQVSNQFSPFISEDDSSEINDISPSPIGPMGKLNNQQNLYN